MIEGRVCTQCKTFKPVEKFSWKLRGKRLGARCHECRAANYKQDPTRSRERAKAHYWANREKVSQRSKELRKENIGKYLVAEARRRAKSKGLAFNLEVNDVQVPEVCPVLGIPMFVSEKNSSPNSPTLDRIIPERGYVRGNVRVISHRANTIKSDASIDEIEAVYLYMRDAIKNE